MSSVFEEIPPIIRKGFKSEIIRKAKKMWLLYVFFAMPAVALLIFNYIPIYGVLIAFKDYRISKGILGSPWNNLQNFRDLFESYFFARALKNTLLISIYRILFGFPAPIILAILINEVRSTSLKKITQSISYLPHFLSWVVLAGIIGEVLSPERGVLAYFFRLFNREAPNVLIDLRYFRAVLISTGIWQSMGWGSIIYLAAISSIDPELYEAAEVDGAGRFRKAIYITIPSISHVITILFILRLRGVLSAGFDQILNLYQPVVYDVADIIDTYVYRMGVVMQKYAFSTAVGLFKNITGLILILATNSFIRRFSEYGIW